MHQLLPAIREWFLPRQDYLVQFAKADCRLEGWFKAEMIVLLNRLKASGAIDAFQREAALGEVAATRRKSSFDFLVLDRDDVHVCEVKALCISRAAGTPRNLRFYFRDDNVGLIRDFRKLDRLPRPPEHWVMSFVYPNPGPAAWAAIVASLTPDLQHWGCVTNPDQFPEHLFIGLWRSAKPAVGAPLLD